MGMVDDASDTARFVSPGYSEVAVATNSDYNQEVNRIKKMKIGGR